MSETRGNIIISISLVVSAIIIGSALVYSSRNTDAYQLSTSPLGVYRMNKITGEIKYCDTVKDENGELWIVDCLSKHQF